MDDRKIEAELQLKGLNFPRVTNEQIDSKIVDAKFHRFDGTTVTVCCLTLANGYTVIGHSACADPRNFDEEIGRKIARDDARRQIWALEGYALRERMSAAHG